MGPCDISVTDAGVVQWALSSRDDVALQQFGENRMAAAEGPTPHFLTVCRVCSAMEAIESSQVPCPCRENNTRSWFALGLAWVPRFAARAFSLISPSSPPRHTRTPHSSRCILWADFIRYIRTRDLSYEMYLMKSAHKIHLARKSSSEKSVR